MSDRKVIRSAPGRLHQEKRGGGVANNNITNISIKIISNINIMSCQIRTSPGRLHQEKRGSGVPNNNIININIKIISNINIMSCQIRT